MAKNLVSYAIHHGIITTADAMIRYDMFGIVQNGVYAYDNPHDQSTITLDGKSSKHKEETMSSIWNTQKSSTEKKSVWGSISPEPQQQVVNPNASVFEAQHVYESNACFLNYPCQTM